MSTAVMHLSSDIPLSGVVLSNKLRAHLEAVLLEWKNRNLLLDRGLNPRSKLLFHGPPGCGKSLSARALGYELGLPVYLVRFSSVIGAYLGQTAINLRSLFHFAESTPCILLLDELDAIGRKRGSVLDVGELDRIVIALMQELDHSKPLGVVVATSNLEGNLDDALWRRFDLALDFPSPSRATLLSFSKSKAKDYRIQLPRQVLDQLSRVTSFAIAESLVQTEARRQVLGEVRDG